MSFEHRYETVNGIRIHYVVSGSSHARAVVLLAGYPESWYAWRKMMPLLADRYRLIAIDLPGQGDSDKPLEGYDTQHLATRVHALLQQLGIERYALVAHDVGAWVAFPYAFLFASEVTALVLMDAGIPGVTLPDSLPTSPDRAWRTWHFPFHAIPDLPEALIAGRERIYLDWFLRRKAADPTSFSDADLDEYVRIMTLPGALRAGLAFYRAVPLSAEQNRQLVSAGTLAVPLLAITADQGSIPDMTGPLRPFVDVIASETITRCGHFLQEEQSDALATVIDRFLSAGAATN